MIKKNNKSKISLTFVIFITILFIIILFLYLINRYKSVLTYESFTNFLDGPEEIVAFKYYRCEDKQLGPILKDIFDSNNIIQSNGIYLFDMFKGIRNGRYN